LGVDDATREQHVQGQLAGHGTAESDRRRRTEQADVDTERKRGDVFTTTQAKIDR